jgi:hypothetical protein
MKKKISKTGKRLKNKQYKRNSYIDQEFNKIYNIQSLNELDNTNKTKDQKAYKENKNKIISYNWAKLKLEQARKDRQIEIEEMKNINTENIPVINTNSQSITDHNDQSTVLSNCNISEINTDQIEQ